MYRANLPYPPIRAEEENLYYARMLMRDYAGLGGELTVAQQYQYQSIIMQPQNEALSLALQKIAAVEMHHLRMVGEMIFLLGGDPKYRVMRSRRPVYYSGVFVDYSKTMSKILMDNIAAEEKTICNYTDRLQQIGDPYIQVVIRRIIQDEQVHIAVFKQFLGI